MRKFNEAEIKEIIRTARVFAAQFTEEKYQKLVQMQQEIADSDFIEAAWGCVSCSRSVVSRVLRHQAGMCSLSRKRQKRSQS